MKRTSSSSSAQAKQRHQDDDDDDRSSSIRFERTGMVGLTLMFEEIAVEKHWQAHQLKRNFGISVRFLFFASLFQGLFLWSDILEQRGELFGTLKDIHLLCMRLLLGGFSLLSCFLVSTGLLLPTQVTIFWVNLIYGLPTIAIYYLTREKLSHWDSLYIVYGLSFFVLPKLSPLSFIYGFTGSSIVTMMFIYISAFRLSLNQWLLSNTLLLAIFFLFMYVSYSFEKSSRERWMLRERLKRENINLDLVASSIHDDLKKTTSDKRTFSTLHEIERETYALQVGNKEKCFPQMSKDVQLLRGNTGNYDSKVDSNDDYNSSAGEDDNDKLSKTKRQSMNQFFKGLGAWALLLLIGNAFDFAYKPISYHNHQVDSSAVSALMMHSMGFSVFLLYFTGKIRWLILNGAVGFVMLWIFNATGIDNQWVLVSTHSVGYVVLATTIIIMILVFGGVVLVWSNLIDFLKDVLVRYPQVKDDLSQKKVLEQVLIGYISQIPKTEVLHPIKVGKSDEFDEDVEIASDQRKQSRAHARAGRLMDNRRGRYADGNIYEVNSSRDIDDTHDNSRRYDCSDRHSSESDNGPILEILSSRRPSYCFFCLQASPSFLVPACSAWNPRCHIADRTNNSRGGESDDSAKTGLPICTPYQSLALARDQLKLKVNDQRQEIEKLNDSLKKLQEIVEAKETSLKAIHASYKTLEALHLHTKRSLESQLDVEVRQKEMEVQRVISQHNAQLTDLKRLHKKLHATQLRAMEQLKAQAWMSGNLTNEIPADLPVIDESSQTTSNFLSSPKDVGMENNFAIPKKDSYPVDKSRIIDRVKDKTKYIERSHSKTPLKGSREPTPSKNIKISPVCDTTTSSSLTNAHSQNIESSTVASRISSLESMDSSGSEDSVVDADELSNFFKASIEEIEEFLRNCYNTNPCDHQNDINNSSLNKEERIDRQQVQHLYGSSRMKYAINFDG